MNTADISSSRRNDIFGLCREHVPLGVIARALSLPAYSVKAVATEFRSKGLIGEMPADDIRAGMILSWPEKMLPDAPEMPGEQLVAPEIKVPLRTAKSVANLSPNLAKTLFKLRQIAPGTLRWSLCDYLAGRERHAQFEELVGHLRRLGFQTSADSVKVTISHLRRYGLQIVHSPGIGYRMDGASRELWTSATGGDYYA